MVQPKVIPFKVEDRRSPDGSRLERHGDKPDDSFYEQFASDYERTYGIPYRKAKKDFVQLAKLRKDLQNALTQDSWNRAIRNYFVTPQSSHTMADLCVRYSTFQKHPLDRYGKPVRDGIVSPKTLEGIPEMQDWAKKRLAKNGQ